MQCVVIGTGSIGFRHLSVLQNGGESVAALPKRSDRAAELERSGCSTVSSLAEAVGRGATHAIVASDTRLHTADAIAALEAGLDVLVEKPLTPMLHDALRIRQSATETGHRVFVGCTLRFSESLQKFRAWLPSLGAVHSVRVECQSYLPDWRPARPYRDSYSARADEGGVLRDTIHEIDYAGWLFGWPQRVQANLCNLGRLGIASEEMADLFWKTPGGSSVAMSLDYLTRPTSRKLIAHGERGTVEWDAIGNRTTLQVVNEQPAEFVSTQTRDAMLLAQDVAFLRGTPNTPLATLDDALQAIAICDAARQSSASRQEEPVAFSKS